MQPESYLSVASILSGFGVAVLMFRIQRELHVREKSPNSPNWLAWADYLVLSAILLSLLLVVFPLMAFGQTGGRVLALAAGSCAAAAILLAAYPFAILDHYRIELGAKRQGDRHKGEPIEKAIVIVAGVFAAGVFGAIVTCRW